jgi:hypothetical protein
MGNTVQDRGEIMPEYRYVVLTNAVVGKDVEFNRWYDERHLPDLLAIPGITNAERAEASEGENLPFRYCAIYDITTDDIAGVLAEIERRANTDLMPLTETLDQNIGAYMYKVRDTAGLEDSPTL